MSNDYEYIEWNHPFTGYDYDDFLLQRLRLEYQQDALHDQWKGPRWLRPKALLLLPLTVMWATRRLLAVAVRMA